MVSQADVAQARLRHDRFPPEEAFPSGRPSSRPMAWSSPRTCRRPGWVEERLSDSNMSTVRSLLPNGFPAYARVFHPAYLNDDEEQPVRWSTVASWTRRTVHPLMQFQRVAGLPEGPYVNEPDPPWGSRRSDQSWKRSAVPWSKRSGASPQSPNWSKWNVSLGGGGRSKPEGPICISWSVALVVFGELFLGSMRLTH